MSLALIVSRLEKAVSNRVKVLSSVLFGAIGPVGVDTVMTLLYGSNASSWVKGIALMLELALPSVIIYLLWSEIRQLHNSALIDPLSGLYNRRGGNDILFSQLRNAFYQRRNRKHVAIAVAFIDIDYFKKINDTFGHAIGDQVIQKLSQIIRTVFPRITDVCVRQGGDEFVVMLPQHATATKQKMDELVRLVSESLNFVDGQHVGVTLSIGIASGYISRNEDLWGDELAAVFTRADQALYLVKTGGRNGTKILREMPPDSLMFG